MDSVISMYRHRIQKEPCNSRMIIQRSGKRFGQGKRPCMYIIQCVPFDRDNFVAYVGEVFKMLQLFLTPEEGEQRNTVSFTQYFNKIIRTDFPSRIKRPGDVVCEKEYIHIL